MIAREVPESQRIGFLARFNLKPGENGVLDGIPITKGFVPRNNTEKKMLSLIEKFYANETAIHGNPEAKKTLDKLLKEHPEFAMMIGKVQHGTHCYSVDIHTLELLKKALNNPSYNALSDEGKEVLKHAAIMHDCGKRGFVRTPGHAQISRNLAKQVLDTYPDMPQETKNRILNLIENHHWFEGYNTNTLSYTDFAKIFPNKEDQNIAMILAKSDFESVSPSFHLTRLVDGKALTPEQYESTFEQIMTNLRSKIS